MTQQKIIVLGTGGTIAGTAASSSDHTGYTSAQLGIDSLLHSVPGLQEALQGLQLASEQVAQLDSKDMDFATMLRIAQRCSHHLAQQEVRGIVITHGTDTLEETAYFLHRVIPTELQAKPVVLTCAMRPATSSQADGPGNLRDAVCVAGDAQARGVLSVCAGHVHHALAVQKLHTYALNAFSSGDEASGEPRRVAQLVNGKLRWNTASRFFIEKNRHIPHVESTKLAIDLIANQSPQTIHWPRVEMIFNHTQQDGGIVHALLAASTQADPLRGIVVAGTGNGTVSEQMQSALYAAQKQGVEVVIATRCVWDDLPNAGAEHLRQPAKARVALMLKLLKTA